MGIPFETREHTSTILNKKLKHLSSENRVKHFKRRASSPRANQL